MEHVPYIYLYRLYRSVDSSGIVILIGNQNAEKECSLELEIDLQFGKGSSLSFD